MRKSLIGFLFVLNVLLFTGLVFIPETPINSDSDRIFIIDNMQDVFIYRLDQKGLAEVDIWGTQSHWFDKMIVDDLNQDGYMEWYGSRANKEISAIDMVSQDVLWTFGIPTLSLKSFDMETGDFDGDGILELMVNHYGRVDVGSQDLATFMLSASGELMQVFPSQTESIYGSFSFAVGDFDQNGDDELVISYGASLFNYQNYSGSYLLQYWDWNDQNQQMELVWDENGIDQGGNINLDYFIHDNGAIFLTSGWYDNPIRAFDEKGELLWNRTLPKLGDYNRSSQPSTGIYIEKQGNPHFYVADYAYETQREIYWHDLDPFTGENTTEPLVYTNSTGIRLRIEEDFAVVQEVKYIAEISQVVSYFHTYSLPDMKYMGTFPNYEAEFFKANHLLIDILILDKKPTMIKYDDGSRLALFSLEKTTTLSSRLHMVMNSAVSIDIEGTLDDISGIYVYKFPNYASLYIIIIVLINFLILMTVLLKPRFDDYRFNRGFGTDWKFALLKQLHKILDTNQHLLSLGGTVKNDDQIHIDYHQASLSQDFPAVDQFRILLDRVGRDALSLQSGDIAVLIEIAHQHYLSTVVEIHHKFPRIARSTIYRRVDKLFERGLIQFSDNLNKLGNISLTLDGEMLLKALYISLKSYYSNL